MRVNEMAFPADIKGCMKDCILSLFWPRKDIVGFFEKHGCTKAEISNLQLEGENALKRHEVVDALFNALALPLSRKNRWTFFSHSSTVRDATTAPDQTHVSNS